jgi:hypothetical protein
MLISWPLLATVPLAVCIFVELLYITKVFFNAYIIDNEESLNRYILKIKDSIFDVESA